jgi:hypothetical protein
MIAAVNKTFFMTPPGSTDVSSDELAITLCHMLGRFKRRTGL